MKRILIELDDACVRDLERVAPVKERKRAEFVRLAVRRAVDLALDRRTEQAYRAQPMAGDSTPSDLAGWDEQNALAKPAVARKTPRRGHHAA
jgi:Arc/MetJ family transcription regulator